MNSITGTMSNTPDLAQFFILGVSFTGGCLSIEISSKASLIQRIEFGSQEAFQVFHESDFHPIFDRYDLSPFTPVYEGDCAIFRIEQSPFYDLFRESNGRYLQVMPNCFLISTADERVEVITFDEPSFA